MPCCTSLSCKIILIKLGSRRTVLRNEISFPQPIYYVFMMVDIVGRSVWIIYLIPGNATVTLRSFLAALTEMIRRVCWNCFRVENEQIGNTDSFKIMRDLPLPYRQKLKEEENEEVTQSGSGGERKKKETSSGSGDGMKCRQQDQNAATDAWKLCGGRGH